MAQEIERKFLVKGDFKAEAHKATHITQGYLCSVAERTVRIRIKDDKGYITVKGIASESGVSRFEWEKEIPVEDARQLLLLAEPGIIDKTRYLIKAADGVHTWEVDEFYGDNEGLTMAEIADDGGNRTCRRARSVRQARMARRGSDRRHQVFQLHVDEKSLQKLEINHQST